MMPAQEIPSSTRKSTHGRSVWPFFAAAIFLVIIGQLAFYVVAFSSGADVIAPGDDSVPGPPPPAEYIPAPTGDGAALEHAP